MSEGEKIHGWVAWHPELDLYPATEDGGIYVAEDIDGLRLSDNSPNSNRMRKQGWRIRPVKVVFLDEVENENKVTGEEK